MLQSRPQRPDAYIIAGVDGGLSSPSVGAVQGCAARGVVRQPKTASAVILMDLRSLTGNTEEHKGFHDELQTLDRLDATRQHCGTRIQTALRVFDSGEQSARAPRPQRVARYASRMVRE
jgi:hypothetical protein